MGLTGERCQRLGDLTQCRLGVDTDSDLSAGVGMACIAVGDRLAEVPFDPGEGGVAQPVGADLVAGGPGQVAADAVPEVVVAAFADGSAVAVAQYLAGE